MPFLIYGGSASGTLQNGYKEERLMGMESANSMRDPIRNAGLHAAKQNTDRFSQNFYTVETCLFVV